MVRMPVGAFQMRPDINFGSSDRNHKCDEMRRGRFRAYQIFGMGCVTSQPIRKPILFEKIRFCDFLVVFVISGDFTVHRQPKNTHFGQIGQIHFSKYNARTPIRQNPCRGFTDMVRKQLILNACKEIPTHPNGV